MEKKRPDAELWRRRIARVIEIGSSADRPSRAYDYLLTAVILINLTASVLLTFDEIEPVCGGALRGIEAFTVVCFAADFILRLCTAKYLVRTETEAEGIRRYLFSFTGIVDLLSFLPYFLPVFFPSGIAAFRMFRVMRIFRLFRITAYYDSLNAITEVIAGKKQQLLSSVFIILVLMLGSSLCMYSVEHEAQPEVFRNAFSGIWWSVSTLLTVGYGDIYPVTTLGKLLGIVIAFLGVGIVAIPTGIISAGFVEQYGRAQSAADVAREQDIHFIKFRLEARDPWVGQEIRSLGLPRGVILTAVHREGEVLIPRGDMVLLQGDTVILGAEPLRDRTRINLKELVLLEHHPWNGQLVRDLDISRQTILVMVKRGNRVLIPKGTTRLQAGDTLLLHTKSGLSGSTTIHI